MTNHPKSNEISAEPGNPALEPAYPAGPSPDLSPTWSRFREEGSEGEAAWPVSDWDRYSLESLQGVGGMGRVFKAWDPRLNRHVALKFLTSTDPDKVQRFFNEARAQARVEHPHICKVYEVGEAQGHPYIAMQFIAGGSFGALADQLTIEQKVLIVKQVAEAMHFSHRAGLIHRDLKPSNIMVEPTPEGGWHPYVVDFGLVRDLGKDATTISGSTLGTPAYMAPEQALGRIADVDRRTDVYGLGATLYALLGRQPPYVGESAFETMMHVANDEPGDLRSIAPNVPGDLASIVMKCLEKEPSRRYDSARALADDLRRFLDGEPVLARPAGVGRRIARYARRNRRLVTAVALFVLVLFILTSFWLRDRGMAAKRAELAQRFGQRLEQVESVLWRHRSLEPHDMRAAEAQARRQLQEIEQEMAGYGPAAEGPGHSTVGRGYLALLDIAGARSHLDRAWAGGYRTPETAFALGLAMGELYNRELRRLDRIADRTERDRRRREIEAEYRRPARDYLQSSIDSDLVSPSYLRGLLAYYDGQHEDAIKRARAAFARDPWLHEAKILEGDAHAAMGQGRMRRGLYEEAMADFDRAEARYRESLTIGKSDIRGHLALARLKGVVLNMEVWLRGRFDSVAFENALDAYRSVLRVSPDSVEAYRLLAEAYSSQAEYQLRMNLDATEAVTRSLEASRKAVELGPADLPALANLALALWQRGKLDWTDREDPTKAWREGLRVARRAAMLDPSDPAALLAQGLISLDIGSYLSAADEDPSRELRLAVECFQKLHEISPGKPGSLSNLAIAHYVTARDLLSRGKDPSVACADAVAACMRVLESDPRMRWANKTLGSAYTILAEYDVTQDRDPRANVLKARGALRSALTETPDDLQTILYLCESYSEEARYLLSQDRSPMGVLGEGIRTMDELTPRATTYLNILWWRVDVELMRAEWMVRSGQSPDAPLATTAQYLQRIAASPNADDMVKLGEAGTARVRAAWLMKRGQSVANEIGRGISLLGLAEDASGPSPETMLTRARLLMVRARATGDPRGRRKDAREAVGCFERATEKEPVLRALVRREVDEARSMAAGADAAATPGGR